MSDNKTFDENELQDETLGGETFSADDEHNDYKPVDRFDASAVHHLSECTRIGFSIMRRM